METLLYTIIGGAFSLFGVAFIRWAWLRFLNRKARLEDERELNQDENIKKNAEDLEEFAKEIRRNMREDIKELHTRIDKVGERLNHLDQSRFLEEKEIRDIFGNYQRAVWEHVAKLENNLKKFEERFFDYLNN